MSNRGLECATITNELKHSSPATVIFRSHMSLSVVILSPTTDVDTSTLVCSVNKLNKAPLCLPVLSGTLQIPTIQGWHEFRVTLKSGA